MVSHSSIQIGRIINSYGAYKTHVDEHGLFIVCKIRSDTETANEVWERILSGEINGFSIGGEVINKKSVCNDFTCWNEINEIKLYEVSVTSHPVNKASTFMVISKSHGRSLDTCNDVCNKEKSEDDNNDNMARTKKKELCEDKRKELETQMDAIKEFLLENPDATTEDAIKSLYDEITKEVPEEPTTPEEPEIEEKTGNPDDEDNEEDEEDDEGEDEEEEEDIDKPTEKADEPEEPDTEEKSNDDKIVELVKAIVAQYGMTVSKADEISEIRKEWEEFKSDVTNAINLIKSIDAKNKEIDELKKSNAELTDTVGTLQKTNQELKVQVETLEKSEMPSKIVRTISKAEEPEDVPIYVPKYLK
jgi:segregation and condensation protein B